MLIRKKEKEDNKNEIEDIERGKWVVTIQHRKARSSGNIPLDLN